MDERRKAFRIRCLEGRDVALLRVGREDVEVQLQNESSCGFGVLSPPDLKFSIDQILHLRTVCGWFQVKATRIQTTPDGTLLGLDRICEVGNLDRKPKWVPWMGMAAAVAVGLLALPAAGLVMQYFRPPKPAAANQQPAAEVAQQTTTPSQQRP
jgi:hypothetical protein